MKSLTNLEIAGPRPYADVRAFGAAGDGATDDTGAFQSALDVAGPGGRVFMPAGTYRLRLGAITTLRGIELFGAGAATVLMPVVGQSGNLFTLADDNSLHDFTIDGDASNSQLALAVSIPGGKRNHLDGLAIRNLKGTCVYWNGTTVDLFIENCRCEDYSGSGINGEHASTNSLDRFRIVGNHCSTSTGAPDASVGIGVFNGTRGEISGNYVDGQATTVSNAHHINGISLGGCSYVTITGNRSRRNRDDAITLFNTCTDITISGNVLSDSAQTGGVYIGGPGRRVTIGDNIMTNNGTAGNGNGFGIYLNDDLADSVIEGNVCSGNVYGIYNPGAGPSNLAKNVSIVGNQCVGNLRSGIHLSGGSRYKIIGNSCRNNGQSPSGQDASGILLNRATDCLVVGNSCEDDQGTATQTYGIRLLSSARNNLVGNYATGNLFNGIYLVDSDNNLVQGNYVAGNSQQVNAGYFGIQVFASQTGLAQNNLINGNVIRRGTGAKQQRYGILLQAGNNTVTENDLTQSGTNGAVSDGGTGNVVRSNRGHNPQGAASVSVGTSPFTYTAGNTPEAIYIRGGQVSSVTKNGVVVFDSSPATVWLEPGESVTITFKAAPTITKDRK